MEYLAMRILPNRSEVSRLESLPPGEILSWACVAFRGRVVLASSLGIEDQVLLAMSCELGLEIPVFTLDTGRLFRETYDLIAATERKYGRPIKLYFPQTEAVERMVEEHGVDLFRKSVWQRRLCCQVRKLEPMSRALAPYDAWLCGLRREQAAGRADVPVVGADGQGRIKISPLATWTEAQVREYARAHDVPYSTLHDKGFPSVGCACCTRAVAPGEPCRAGRWWWEDDDRKECGLHMVNGRLVRQGHSQENDER